MKYKNKNKFIQYELWKDCHIGCKFCCNFGQKDLDKKKSLLFVLNKLQDKELNQYNQIGFIGGQFFNGELKNQQIKQLFYKLFQKIANKDFDKIYFTSALICNLQQYVIPFLEYLKKLNILNKCLLCTSYDTLYRFKSNQQEQLWKNNMLFLLEKYPELSTHVEIILTQDFINKVLSNQFNITEFCKIYRTRIDYMDPGAGFFYKTKENCAKYLPHFFPTKSLFLKFLQKAGIENNELDFNTFCSMQVRSNKLYCIMNGHKMILDKRRDNKQPIAIPKQLYKPYQRGLIDTDKSMEEIAKEFYLLYNGESI